MQRTWSRAHPTVQRELTQILPGFGHLVDTQMQKLMSQDITVSTGGGTPMPSVVSAQADIFAKNLTKIGKILRKFNKLDKIKSLSVLCQS